MWAFGIHRSDEIGKTVMFFRSGYIPSREDIADAQWYTCISMLIFHLGALITSITKKKMNIVEELPQSKIIYQENTKKAMKIVGIVLLSIITPIAFAFRFKEVLIARKYGYIALYNSEYSTQSGYIPIILFLFFPAIVCYLIGSNHSKISQIISYAIFGIYAALSLLAGYRGAWLYSFIILIWLSSRYNKISIRKYFAYLVLLIIGIYILDVIRNVRDSGFNFSIKDFFSLDRFPIINAFFEMGDSMGIIVYFLNHGNEIYPYGNTYITALLGAISSRFLDLLGLKQVFISNWFSQEYLGLSYGTGFSMIGEAYVNGGYFGGLIYIFIWGIFIGKLLQYSKNNILSMPLRSFISVAGLNAVIGVSRNACYLTIKELVYGVGFVCVLIWFCSNIFTNKR